MGAEVTVLSTSDRKKADAERMGAKHFLINSDKAAMKAAAEKLRPDHQHRLGHARDRRAI